MNCEETRVNLNLDKFNDTSDVRQSSAADGATDLAVQSSIIHPKVLQAKSLTCGAWLVLEDSVGTLVYVERGEVWISEEGSFIDHILVSGQRYAIDRPGKAIISMQSQASLAMHLPTAGMPPRSINLHASADDV